MYHDFAGREREDAEMDAMKEDRKTDQEIQEVFLGFARELASIQGLPYYNEIERWQWQDKMQLEQLLTLNRIATALECRNSLLHDLYFSGNDETVKQALDKFKALQPVASPIDFFPDFGQEL